MKVQWVDAADAVHDVPEEGVTLRHEMDERRYEIVFDSGGQEAASIVVFPGVGEIAFQLMSIQVELDTPGGSTILRRVASGSEDLGSVAFESLRPFQVNGFTYLAAESDDARFRLRVDSHESGEQDFYRVRIRMLVADATSAAGVRAHFLDHLKAAENRVRELESELERFRADASRAEALDRELRLVKSSRIWRAAERFRHAFYHRALARFPGLRQRLLGVSRRRVRQAFTGTDATALGTLASDRLQANPRDEAYQALVNRWEASRPGDDAIGQAIEGFEVKPTVSVVMPVRDTPVEWLREAVESVLAQRYDNFELCLCDDASSNPATIAYLDSIQHPKVKSTRLAQSAHIAGATNAALTLARGEYVAFLDHDDRLDPDALFHVVSAVNDLDPDVVYTDEDYLDGDGRRFRPLFKPDFSPDLLLSHNYITHLLVVRRSLLESVGGLDSRFDGAQDHDLVLRLSEMASSIAHVPRVLYHWRQSAGSSSLDVAAKPYVQERARGALKAAMERRGIEADILNANLPHFFYTRRRLSGSPGVSVIIPFRDQPALLERCLNSVLRKTTWSEYEVIGVNNQSVSPITFELMEAYRANPRVKFLEYDEAFNFSAIVNRGVENARGEFVVLLNNDIEIITWQWIEEMLCQATGEGTGAVGGKLFYPDNTVQHAGIVLGIDGYAGHGHKRFECHAQGYANRLQLVQNVSAVTGAFMMVRKDLFETVGGFDEEAFPVACNDIDFCLRLIEAGYWNVFTPHAQGYHVESASRGYEMTEEKRKRFDREKALFRERHTDMLSMGDPFYNPNLSLDNESFMIVMPGGGAKSS